MPANPGESLAIIKSHVDFDTQQKLRKHDGSAITDWELLPELPTSAEIMNPDASTESLPWHPVKHRYDSKGEYIQSLYQILRFEGTEGLRYSVNTFKALPNMKDSDETCVYTKIRIKGYMFARIGPIARVSFSTYRAGARIKWQQSQRLMPGKIVALSMDNFVNDCRIAVIAQRPFEGGLDQNPPLVDLMWADPSDAVINPDQELVMIESRNGYYEAVRHALRGLQHAMREGSPIDKYAVKLDSNDRVCRPASKQFDLRTLVSHLTAEQIEKSKGEEAIQQRMFQELKDRFNSCSLGDFHKLKPYTNLDDSQLEALERMISKELAIIQGPPGTGKTHTSIQSLKVILANRKAGDPPVVIAAQTNHALDQLLMHGINSNVNIMRVGGRTENEKIKERSMYELRKMTGRFDGQSQKMLKAAEKERRTLVSQFEALVSGIFGGEGLLDPATLLHSGIITERQFRSLEDDDWETGEDKSPMDVWLGEEKIERNRQLADDLDFAEMEAVDEIFELDANLDDDQQQKDDDEDRIYGEFVSLSSQHTGVTPLIPYWENRCREMLDNDSLFNVPRGYRGGVYQVLQSKLVDKFATQLRDLLRKAGQVAQKRKIARWSSDLHIVDKHSIDVVGCTTTGLTKYRGFLSALQPRILLVEEAAETREANIVSALFPCLRQLILVGDHQQLPPSCDISRLGADPYNLNVSLFERFVENDLPYTMLNQQRRMAPELSFIVKKYYTELQDHPLVTQEEKRPLIPGMGNRRCWFFNHQWPEDTDADNSKFNLEEAEMVVAFIVYLLRNGVSASEITVLTYYKGQKRKILQRLGSKDVPIGSFFKVSTVDSYQGEENDVVLLSLVRSPQYGRMPNVGFLESRNRATVAVSRARRGLFLFGNKSNLLSASYESLMTWGPVWNGFAEQKRVATAKGLPLICQKHQNEIWIKEANELADNAGGCGRRCGEIRPCGHPCAFPCHFQSHEELRCHIPCAKKLACGHECGGHCPDPCFCARNCLEFVNFQVQQQMSQLALSNDLITEKFLESNCPSYGAAGISSNQSSPDKWQQFSHNPHVHDDAIRNARLQTGRQAAMDETMNIKETFLLVSHGQRLVPASQAAGRHVPEDTESELEQMESGFGRNAIGYEEYQASRQLQNRVEPLRNDGRARRPFHVTNSGARSTRISESRAQLGALSRRGRKPEFEPVSVGYDGSAVLTDTGFEAEVLGMNRRPAAAKAPGPVSKHNDDEPLIDFDA